MAQTISRMYRNDSENVYDIPGLGLIGPGQRVAIHSEFPPAINLANYPGLVDVHEEEANPDIENRDYDANPEPKWDEAEHRRKMEEQAAKDAAGEQSAPENQTEGEQNG